MAKEWFSGFLSLLHREHLKRAGFTKEGTTFSRDRGDYVERFHFQGSSASSETETRFYLNVGVEFAEFGPAERNWVYFKRTHWAARIGKLVPTNNHEHFSCLWSFCQEVVANPARHTR